MMDALPSSVDVEKTLLSHNVDQILSNHMESLSFQDRNLIQEEVHGVTNLCPEENPQMMQEALQSMHEHLENIEHKPVYDNISPLSYIHTDKFRLRFLRCELYDAKKAAERLVRFTEYMNDEYDMEVLERPLRLTDLQSKTGKKGKEIMDFFKQGYTQLLPFRDRSGRRVIVNHVKALPHDPVLRFKVYQYLLLVGSSDTETQKKGMVVIQWGRNPSPKLSDAAGEHARGKRTLESLPVRIASVHQCFDDSALLRLVRVLMVLALQGADKKIRLQCHVEDDWEIRYKLLGFGIPVDLLPFTETGNIKTKAFHLWMKGRRAIEEMEEHKRNENDNSPMTLIDCPSSADVIFKTGTPNLSHPGNTSYKDLLMPLCNGFKGSTHTTKQAIVSKIIGEVIQRGGRFLEWNTCGCWVILQDENRLRTKICNSLYHCQKIIDAKTRTQSCTSSTFLFERQDGRKRKRAADGSEQQGCLGSCRTINNEY